MARKSHLKDAYDKLKGRHDLKMKLEDLSRVTQPGKWWIGLEALGKMGIMHSTAVRLINKKCHCTDNQFKKLIHEPLLAHCASIGYYIEVEPWLDWLGNTMGMDMAVPGVKFTRVVALKVLPHNVESAELFKISDI